MAIFWKKVYALFYDDKGEFITRHRIGRWEKIFKYKNKSFNVIEDEATITEIKGLWHDRYYYHYNINNPNPMRLKKVAEPIINSDIYNVQLETKVARDLNDLAKTGLSALLTPRNIIIAIVIIGILVYLLTGHNPTTIIQGQGK
jgi:hypothetical protein